MADLEIMDSSWSTWRRTSSPGHMYEAKPSSKILRVVAPPATVARHPHSAHVDADATCEYFGSAVMPQCGSRPRPLRPRRRLYFLTPALPKGQLWLLQGHRPAAVSGTAPAIACIILMPHSDKLPRRIFLTMMLTTLEMTRAEFGFCAAHIAL